MIKFIKKSQMGLKERFTDATDALLGRGRYAEARDTRAELKGKKLRGRGEKDLKAAEEVLKTRREFLLKAGGGTLVALLGAGAGLKALSEENTPDEIKNGSDGSPSPDGQQVAPSQKPEGMIQEGGEVQTDLLIKKVESGFGEFEMLIKGMLANKDPQTKAALEGPFKVMNLNKRNSSKNYDRTRAQMIASGETEIRVNGSPYFFNYHAASGKDLGAVAAGYNNVSKTMLLNKEFSVKNLHDLLMLYHELIHVAQDTNERNQFRSQEEFNQYISFFTEDRSRVILNFETYAYASEFEILNLMMDGELELAAKENRPVNMAPLEKWKTSFPETEIADFIRLINLALTYFKSGGYGALQYKTAYQKRVAEISRSQGKTVYQKLANGTIEEVHN